MTDLEKWHRDIMLEAMAEGIERERAAQKKRREDEESISIAKQKGNVTKNNPEVEFDVKYRVIWKSDTQRTRKEAYFPTRPMAEEWYDEKLAEGKNPHLWMEETTTIVHKLK